jgi:hypothetical protein
MRDILMRYPHLLSKLGTEIINTRLNALCFPDLLVTTHPIVLTAPNDLLLTNPERLTYLPPNG